MSFLFHLESRKRIFKHLHKGIPPIFLFLTIVCQKLFKMEFFQTGVFPNPRHPFLGEEKPVGNIPTGSTNYIPSFAFINKILSFAIREILKSLDESSRLRMETKVPLCSKRSTCTLSTLINLNAELMSLVA